MKERRISETNSDAGDFRAFLALNRCVRKGETAIRIRILAPCPPSKAKLEVWRAAGADPREKRRTFFG